MIGLEEELDFDSLSTGGVWQEYRDMLDDSQGLPSEAAFLDSIVDNPLDAGIFTGAEPTDEDNFGLTPGFGAGQDDFEPMDEDFAVEDDYMREEEAESELDMASRRELLSQMVQEKWANRRG